MGCPAAARAQSSQPGLLNAGRPAFCRPAGLCDPSLPALLALLSGPRPGLSPAPAKCKTKSGSRGTRALLPACPCGPSDWPGSPRSLIPNASPALLLSSWIDRSLKNSTDVPSVFISLFASPQAASLPLYRLGLNPRNSPAQGHAPGEPGAQTQGCGQPVSSESVGVWGHREKGHASPGAGRPKAGRGRRRRAPVGQARAGGGSGGGRCSDTAGW